MIRRMLVLAGAAGMLVAALATSVGAAGSDGTITVVERALTDTTVDLGATGDSLGDMLMFGNPIYDAANANKIGRDEGSCARTNPGVAWECSWTTIVPKSGSITVQGPFYDDLRDSWLSITGGTGTYRNARGQMKLHARNAAGSEFDFVFYVIG
ncbi:MAG TPA: dirigent protein [Candidatus Limnocylindrales bacterium]